MTARAHRHFETTPVSIHACRRCRAAILYGLAEGIPARVDPTPLTPAAETAAVFAARATYTLRRFGLVERDEARRRDPTLAAPVLASHVCPGRSR